MRLYVTFLLIIGAADYHHAWEIGNEYHFLIQSRTLTALDKLAQQFSGILMKGTLIVQVKSPDTLQAVVSETQYAPVHKLLPKGWDAEITDLEYNELSLSGKPFEIKLKHGVIRDMLIDQDVPTWEVNLLKSIVSQLQIDTQGENAIATRGTQVPNDDQLFGTFKAMEDSVGGKCEVFYDITPLLEDVLLKKPELVPLPELRKGGHHFDIIKTKNYTRCEQRMAYHFGITDKMNWKPGTNDGLLSRSSTSRILISGNLKHFTIQSSVTTNKIFVNSKIHDTYSGAVYSRMNLTLDRMSNISNPMPPSNNLVSTGNLVYIYNNPSSSYRKMRQPSVSQSSLAARSSENRSSSEESSDDDRSSFSSSSTSNNEERDYLQPKPKLDEAPESPLLPYFVGYKGKSIQKSEEDYALVAIHLIGQITGEIEYFTVNMLEQPFTETLERSVILTRLIRTMNVKQIAEVQSKLPELFYQDDRNKFSNEDDQKFYEQTAWEVFCDAVTNAGTGPALTTIKNWIKNRKLEGIKAMEIISKIPKTARTPTAEYVKAFFELITDEQVTKQKFLNATAPLSFAELVRYTQRNKSSAFYPVYSFGHMTSKNDNALLETYIPYMATQLREAIKDGDSVRIQTYIMALGNFGHPKILSIFEPYLEGTLRISKFQRMMMVISLSKLSESFPRIARSVAYKIYVNVMEAYEIRCVAVYIIMKTNPPLSMLQRMAEFTNQDEDRHVNSVIKSIINDLANLKQPEFQDLANKACIARKLLSPQYYDERYSHSIIREEIVASLNIGQTSIVHMLGSDDTNLFKGAFLGAYQSNGGFNLPSMRIIYALSSIKQWLDMGYRVFKNKFEKKLIIEEITKKLGIKPEDAEQLEGNIFVDTLFISVFYPFDNNTSEEIINMMKEYAMSMMKIREFESRNMNHLHQYDMTLGFPTESGLPFIYTLTLPKLTRINSGLSHNMTGSSMELTTAGHILSNEKIQSRVGFVAPFEHRHYIAGIDINTQIFIPAGLSFKTEEEKKFELKINPREYYRYGTGHMTIHHSVVPYTARHDILDLQPVVLSNNTRLVHTKEPHEIKSLIGDQIFAARSDLIDSNALEKTGIEALTEIFNIFKNGVGAHYRKFDAILYPMAAQVNVTFNSFLKLHNPDSSVATIPAIFDKRPESEARREQLLKEVSKNINSATGYIFDISVSTNHNNHVFTLALAKSYVDKKTQALVYWNMQSPNNEEDFMEFCAIGQMRLSRDIYLNVEEAIEQIPKDEINAEMRLGSCADGETIRLKGSLTRSDDLKEMIMKSETLERCRQEMKQGNKGLLACQEASALIQQKNHLLMSVDMDSDYFYLLANKVILMLKTSKTNVEMPGSADKNIIDMEMKLPLDSNSAIFLNTSMMDVTFPLDFIGENISISKIFREKEGLSCTLDKTQAVTFDDKIYPLKLGKCWHVMVTTYPKRDPNNPDKTLTIPEDLRVMVMIREMDDGSKQIRMILGDQEIYLQKSGDRLEVTINEQIADFSRHESYREGKAFEIYERPDGSITIFSLQYEIFAVYDGERIRFDMSYNYLNAVRGLCGNYDMRPNNDFVIPKNCILTRPEEFAATYALTEENCQGSALQNKQKAELSTCIPMSYRPSDVISDREAGRSPTKNRGWGYH